MILIRCYFENGDKYVTATNLSFEEAEKYFVGKIFCLGMLKRSDEDSIMQRCVKIEEAYKSEKIPP